MRERIWKWAWGVVELVNAIGTLFSWFKQLSIGSLLPYQILGIGIAIFFIATLALVLGFMYWSRKSKGDGKKTIGATTSNPRKIKTTIPPEQMGEIIPVFLQSQFHTPLGDAIYNLNIMPISFPIAVRGKADLPASTITFTDKIEGYPLIYSLRLYNTRPTVIELVGYTINILLNGIPVQTVTWDKPNNQTSIGINVSHPIYILGDTITSVYIHALLAQMQGRIPDISPYWTAKGELSFQSDKGKEFRVFDFTNDAYRYILSDSDWKYLRARATPK
jgi:hypothetical protein